MCHHPEDDSFIPLTRPPILIEAEHSWTPRVDPAEVDRIWASIVADNPRAFDGSVLHVREVERRAGGEVVLHVHPCAYRFYAVQAHGVDCGVRALGAKAITRADGRILLGRRATWVMYYPGDWEFVPGGSVPPGRTPAETIVEELFEEVSLRPLHPPHPIALGFDPRAFSWEVIYDLELHPGGLPIGSREYDDLSWMTGGEWPGPLTPIADRMRSLLGEPDIEGD